MHSCRCTCAKTYICTYVCSHMGTGLYTSMKIRAVHAKFACVYTCTAMAVHNVYGISGVAWALQSLFTNVYFLLQKKKTCT